MTRNWEGPVSEAPDVVKLVHLAARMDSYDAESLRGSLLQTRRQAYESELGIQAAAVGCPGRVGRLNNGPILSALNAEALADATSIVNTYNYDLFTAIMAIRAENPRANRTTYAAKLREWSDTRAKWKNTQIANNALGQARSRAQTDFFYMNGGMGSAYMQPSTAQCPVCEGWIARGLVPLRVATNNPPPYHVGCPHFWVTRPDIVAKEECALLWMGE